mmetsp:Transcript_86694/g.163426  ORF Transcript_86694/g.163426 Transcript_86694/m.163426 type:complete len:739 (+) Transcript_86694:60-2276(+)
MVPLKSLWLLCLARGVAAFADVISSNHGDAHGFVTDTCTGEEDAAAHFMQLSGRPLRRSVVQLLSDSAAQDAKVTAISPVACALHRQPMEVSASLDGSGYDVRQLNVETGNYSKMFSIPSLAVPGNYSDLNGCGVNPRDSILYCAMFAEGSWIVRLDSQNVEFVARLPQQNWNTADFSPSGTFFIADSFTGFLVLTDLHTRKGFASKTDPGLWDLRQEEKQYPANWAGTADVVVSFANLNGTGLQEYMFSPYGPYLQIAQYNLTAGNFSGSWVLNVSHGRWDNIFGAGWNFQGKLFFASNGGAGVYQIPLEDITLADGASVNLTRIGSAEEAGKNDGFSCLATPNPWKTAMPAFDCRAHYKPIQILKREAQGVYDVSKLYTETGDVDVIFTIPFNTSGEGDSYTAKLNGVGIGPKDSIMYGIILLAGWQDLVPSASHPVTQWLVRFDGKKYEYVANLKNAKQPVSGTFDTSGNYYYVGDDILYKIPRPDLLKGYANWTAPELPIVDYNSGVQLAGIYEMADIVALPADFDGRGEATWILSVSMPARKLVLVKAKASFDEDVIDGYEELYGDCFGNNIRIFTNTSGTECAASCSSDSNCRGFALSQAKGECVTKDLDCERTVADDWKFYQKVMDKKRASVYTIDINDVVNSSQKQAFGAGWYFNGSVYFSSNDGAGVFRVPTEDITIPAIEDTRITLEKLANSSSIADTDGMSCSASSNEAGLNKLWYGADARSSGQML